MFDYKSDDDTFEVEDSNDGGLVDHYEEKAPRFLSSRKRKRPAGDYKQESRTLDPWVRDQTGRTLADDNESAVNDEEEWPSKRNGL
jgi:hypothetical protein